MTVLADANRIKARLRACQSAEEVDTVAAEERETVMGLKGQPGDAGVMFTQIVNLKKYLLAGYRSTAKGRAA